MKLTREEIEKELQKTRQARFYLQMIDHWSHEDWLENEKLSSRIRELEKQLEELE